MKIKKLIINILVPIAVGTLAALLTKNNMDIYSYLVKPKLAPPSIIFPIAWTTLYILMGVSTYIISKYKKIPKIYYVQLFLNFMWSIIFFLLNYRLLAFIWILLLLISIIIMIKEFYQINKKSAYLQIPYLIWVMFATYLTLMIFILNR